MRHFIRQNCLNRTRRVSSWSDLARQNDVRYALVRPHRSRSCASPGSQTFRLKGMRREQTEAESVAQNMIEYKIVTNIYYKLKCVSLWQIILAMTWRFQLTQPTAVRPKPRACAKMLVRLGPQKRKHVYCPWRGLGPGSTRLQYTAYGIQMHTVYYTCAHCIGLVSNRPFFNLVCGLKASEFRQAQECSQDIKAQLGTAQRDGVSMPSQPCISRQRNVDRSPPLWPLVSVFSVYMFAFLCLPMPQPRYTSLVCPAVCLSGRSTG